MIRRLALCAILFTALIAACAKPVAPTSTPTSQEITVFAAASLTDSFNDGGKQYQAAHPGIAITFNFASSTQLAQQLVQGAPADVFASADARQMESAIAAGRVKAETVVTFAGNRLVVIFPAENPKGLASLGDLARPGMKLVLGAKETPIGQYSLDFLQKASQSPAFGADFQQNVLANVVSYEENVRAVLGKVALGEADAGIAYVSDIAQLPGGIVKRLEIPVELNVNAVYRVAPMTDSAHPQAAADFIAYLLSDDGQDLLAQYGFLPIR